MSKETLLSIELEFSAANKDWNESEGMRALTHFLGCVETIEKVFQIEFSCGDGKHMSELDMDTEENKKYDGVVDYTHPVLCFKNGHTLPKIHLELISENEEGDCYTKVNGKKRATFNLGYYGGRTHVTNFELV